MRDVFLIPGLGTDERIFYGLDLKDANIRYCNFIKASEEIDLKRYAQQFIEHYSIHSEGILIGVSLGGILSSEICRQMPVHQCIIISSIKAINELPWYLKLGKTFPVYKLVDHARMKRLVIKHSPGLGRMREKEYESFREMVENFDEAFIPWALEQVVNWNHKEINDNIIHIHGDRDRLFPIKYVNNPVVVRGGSHIMIVRKKEKINQLLNELMDV